MARETWNREKVIKGIKTLHRKRQPLNARSVEESDRKLYVAAQVHCGSWQNAIIAAGLDYTKIRLHGEWSEEIICDKIRQLYEADQPVNSNHMQKYNQPLYAAAVKYFGGWCEAVEAAGFSYDSVRIQDPAKWNRKKIIRAIRSRKRRRLSLNGGVVDQEDYSLYKATRYHFGIGGWRKALKAAGINPNSLKDPKVIWTKETVIREIKRLSREKAPLNGSYLTDNGYSGLHGCGTRIFGSWEKAIKAAGLDYDAIRKTTARNYWTERRILAAIRRRKRLGMPLSSKIVQYDHGALFRAACKCFGSWGGGVEAAGFDYRLYCKTFSYKTFLRRLDQQETKTIEKRAGVLARKRRSQ